MAWSMTVEDSFQVRGRGVCVTGRPDAEPVRGPAKLSLPDGEILEVEVIGIERFMKLIDPAVPGDNVGLLLRTVLLRSVLPAEELQAVPRGSVIAGS